MDKIEKLTVKMLSKAKDHEMKGAMAMTNKLIKVVNEINYKDEWERILIMKQDPSGKLEYLLSIMDILAHNKKLLNKMIMHNLCRDVCFN